MAPRNNSCISRGTWNKSLHCQEQSIHFIISIVSARAPPGIFLHKGPGVEYFIPGARYQIPGIIHFI